jgi:hypothetical protein
MSTIRYELHQLLDRLPEPELSQVRDFMKVLLEEREELTDEEWEEVGKGEEEIQRGEWVRWEDVRRTDV